MHSDLGTEDREGDCKAGKEGKEEKQDLVESHGKSYGKEVWETLEEF